MSVRRFHRQAIDAVRLEGDVVEQDPPTCPFDSEDCRGLSGPGLSCFRCLASLEEGDA